jgi:hypothetical protein
MPNSLSQRVHHTYQDSLNNIILKYKPEIEKGKQKYRSEVRLETEQKKRINPRRYQQTSNSGPFTGICYMAAGFGMYYVSHKFGLEESSQSIGKVIGGVMAVGGLAHIILSGKGLIGSLCKLKEDLKVVFNLGK